MHVFVNPTEQLDFDDCANKKPTEVIDVVATSGVVEYPVRPSKFPAYVSVLSKVERTESFDIDAILSRSSSLIIVDPIQRRSAL